MQLKDVEQTLYAASLAAKGNKAETKKKRWAGLKIETAFESVEEALRLASGDLERNRKCREELSVWTKECQEMKVRVLACGRACVCQRESK